MKKFLTITLILIIALTAISCGEKDEPDYGSLNLNEPISSSKNKETTNADSYSSELETYADETQNVESTKIPKEPSTTSKEEKDDEIVYSAPTINNKNNTSSTTSSNPSSNNSNNTTKKTNPTENNRNKQNPMETQKSKTSSTESPTQKPTESPKEKVIEKSTEKPNITKPAENKLNITFDSNIFDSVKKTYTTNKNGTVTVCYYIDFNKTNEIRIDSIQFEIKYDTKYLSVDPKKNCSDPNGSRYNLSPMFPIASGSGIVNILNDGTIKFVDSNINGRVLKDSNGLIPIAKVTFDIKKGASGSSKVTLDCDVLDFVNTKTKKRYTMQHPLNGRAEEIYKYISSVSEFYIEIK